MASSRRIFPALFLLACFGAAGQARADEPLTLRESWSGSYGFFSTGAALAKDSDMDGKVDILTQPATVKVTADDLPDGAKLDNGYLYWGGTQLPTKCANKANLDDTVTFTPPGGVPTMVTADVCYCSSSATYEMQLCRAEVNDLVDKLTGDYVVTDFTAAVANTDTANASFALVLVYEADGLNERRIALYDGLFALSAVGTPSATVTLDQLDVSNSPAGDLTWYALEGDVTIGEGEFVQLKGVPGGGTGMLFDDINPANNPFNRTINTMASPKKGVTGVDIDRFSLASVLKPNDTSLEITYSAGMDKYWIAFNIVGVDVTDITGGEFAASSGKSWALTGDVNGDGVASPGDTITYTIHVENTGDTAGVVTVIDQIPAAAASWLLSDAAGGTDKSLGNTMIVEGLALAPLQASDVVLTLVLGDVPDLESVVNIAQVDSGQPEGIELVAPELQVRRDGDGDGVFDSDDNCPELANQDQADSDVNGVGDACDVASGTGSGDTGDGSTSTTGMMTTSGPTPTTGDEQATTAGDATTGVDASTGTDASAGGSGGESAGGGCGCRSADAPTGSLLLLLLGGAAGLPRRRARHGA